MRAPDPIHAAIAAARAASAAHIAACHGLDEDDGAAVERCNQACDADAEASKALGKVRPTTPGGLIALVAFYAEDAAGTDTASTYLDRLLAVLKHPDSERLFVGSDHQIASPKQGLGRVIPQAGFEVAGLSNGEHDAGLRALAPDDAVLTVEAEPLDAQPSEIGDRRGGGSLDHGAAFAQVPHKAADRPLAINAQNEADLFADVARVTAVLDVHQMPQISPVAAARHQAGDRNSVADMRHHERGDPVAYVGIPGLSDIETAWHGLPADIQARIGIAVVDMVFQEFVHGDACVVNDQPEDRPFPDETPEHDAIRGAAADASNRRLNELTPLIQGALPDLFGPDGENPAWCLNPGPRP